MSGETVVRSEAILERRQALARTLFGSGPIRSQMIFVWICVPPIVLYFAAFYLYPIFSALKISVQRYSLMIPEHPFIGFQNYLWAFRDPVFWIAFKNTLYFAVFYVVLSVSIGLALGVLVYGFKQPFKSIMQTTCFIPVMTSMVV
ncbi:MAG: sugar ABC transporter permease, partial [Anaerolineae bacterium]|nr:sugar ABC transporter permease [Anaerolineae bacterium]